MTASSVCMALVAMGCVYHTVRRPLIANLDRSVSMEGSPTDPYHSVKIIVNLILIVQLEKSVSKDGGLEGGEEFQYAWRKRMMVMTVTVKNN